MPARGSGQTGAASARCQSPSCVRPHPSSLGRVALVSHVTTPLGWGARTTVTAQEGTGAWPAQRACSCRNQKHVERLPRRVCRRDLFAFTVRCPVVVLGPGCPLDSRGRGLSFEKVPFCPHPHPTESIFVSLGCGVGGAVLKSPLR